MAKSKDNNDMRIAPPETLAQFGFDEKDFVVPQYTEEGRRLGQGRPVLEKPGRSKIAMAIAMHAQGHGGRAGNAQVSSAPVITKQAAVKPVATKQPQPKPVKSKRSKKATEQPVEPVVETPAEPETPPETPMVQSSTANSVIVFNTPFGKIRSNVEEVMTNEIGFALVFKNIETVNLLPDAGTTLTVTLPEEGEVKAMYTGCFFVDLRRRQYLVFIRDAN